MLPPMEPYTFGDWLGDYQDGIGTLGAVLIACGGLAWLIKRRRAIAGAAVKTLARAEHARRRATTAVKAEADRLAGPGP